jgi:hypothetical protein
MTLGQILFELNEQTDQQTRVKSPPPIVGAQKLSKSCAFNFLMFQYSTNVNYGTNLIDTKVLKLHYPQSMCKILIIYEQINLEQRK